MTPSLCLRNIKTREPNKNSREETLKRLQQWRDADERLKKVCEEKGMDVPEMVC